MATRPLPQNGLGWEPTDVIEDIDDLLLLFPMYRQEEGDFEFWKELVAGHLVRGKTAHDARLVAAMQRHGISHVLTFNGSDFERYAPNISVLSPAGVVADQFGL